MVRLVVHPKKHAGSGLTVHLGAVVGAPMIGLCEQCQFYTILRTKGLQVRLQQQIPALAPLPLEHLHASA